MWWSRECHAGTLRNTQNSWPVGAFLSQTVMYRGDKVGLPSSDAAGAAF